ncbi:MAG: site-specific DNA-methyltransferase [Thermotogaceae bacterium]|nr:site-specific DNA-methyltransferase [Thermotogaceae bacterium]
MNSHGNEQTTLTNEEKRVTVYQKNSTPTVASLVTPNTPLESLNMNWREKDLPERERTKHVHRLHPYLGKFIPQLVEIFLRKYFPPGSTVLDPFCGSSTTLVQANELGVNSIGYDISAFNVLLGKAKITNYDLNLLNKEINDILQKTTNALNIINNKNLLPLWEPPKNILNINTDDEYLKKWFAPQALKELLVYKSFIENENYQYKNLLKIILSRSARSARLTTHFDLDFPKQPQTEPYWCYKHSRICYPTTNAFQFLKRYSSDTIKRIEEFSKLRTNATTQIFHADSRNIISPPIDGVITSPPYVGLIDYHEQHSYAYHLLELDDKRDLEIGPASNGTNQKAKLDYKKDIALVFSNALQSMPVGGRLIVIANDKSNLYNDIGKSIGVSIEAVINRHVNRRTGRRSTEFFESIFIWYKP